MRLCCRPAAPVRTAAATVYVRRGYRSFGVGLRNCFFSMPSVAADPMSRIIRSSAEHVAPAAGQPADAVMRADVSMRSWRRRFAPPPPPRSRAAVPHNCGIEEGAPRARCRMYSVVHAAERSAVLQLLPSTRNVWCHRAGRYKMPAVRCRGSSDAPSPASREGASGIAQAALSQPARGLSACPLARFGKTSLHVSVGIGTQRVAVSRPYASRHLFGR